MRKAMASATVCLVVLGIFFVPRYGVGQTIRITHRSSSKADQRARLALKLAKRLVAVMPKIVQDFQAQRRDLLGRGGGDAYPKDDLARLLDSTEASLKKQLKGDELAPLRDHIAAVFEETRDDLGLSSRAARVPPPPPQIVLASMRPVREEWAAAEERLDREVVDPRLNVVDALIQDLRDRMARKDLTVDLCVASVPKGAKILLRARSGKSLERQKTIARYENLFRGRYCYEVSGKGFKIRCGTAPEDQINIYDKRQPFLECERSDQGCYLREGWPQTCRGR